MQSASLSSLFPKARKLNHELQTTLGYLRSGRGGEGITQQRVREDMSHLQQLLNQLDNLVHTEPESSREMWRKKILWLHERSQALQNDLEQYLIRQNPHVVQRNSLLSRRTGASQATSDDMFATQESQSLQRSSEMVNNLTNLSGSMMSSLSSQGSRLKAAHRKVLEVADRLGMNSSMLRIIERRDFIDKLLVFGGMVVTLLFLFLCIWYIG